MKTMLNSLTLVSQLKVELQKILENFQGNQSPESLLLNFIKLLKQAKIISLTQNKELLIGLLQFLDEKRLSEEEHTMRKVLVDFMDIDKDRRKIGEEKAGIVSIHRFYKDPQFFEILTLASAFTKQTVEIINQVEAAREIKLLKSQCFN